MSATTDAGRRAGTGERRFAPLNPACVACGPAHDTGLRLSFHSSQDGVTAGWTPTHAWQSFQGIIHGGIVATVLDEAMSKAIIARGWEAVTAELRVRYRLQVSPGDKLSVRGWVVRSQKRMILAEASITAVAGVEHAHAWATFLAPPRGST